MDPQATFCPNFACPARGQVGKGNIHVHSRKERRYVCQVCNKTFAETVGTVFYRLHKCQDVITVVLTLLAYGCPLHAAVVAFGLGERTVKAWLAGAGQHCEQVHEHLVQQPRDLGHVQADEIRAKMQNAVLWLAMAIQVSTRLWLGGVACPQRDESLLTDLMQRVRRCTLCRPLLFCVDGWRAYLPAIQKVFRESIPTGKLGRLQLRPWNNICIAQMVKQYAQEHVVGVVRRIVQGTNAQVQQLLQQTHGGHLINTAYIERLNATFRARLAHLVRRSRGLARQNITLHQGLYLIGTVYNFCTDHRSLRLPGIIGGHKWLPRTPAMAAGIIDHRWTMLELLSYHVPPTRWAPSKRRGHVANTTKQLILQWCV